MHYGLNKFILNYVNFPQHSSCHYTADLPPNSVELRHSEKNIVIFLCGFISSTLQQLIKVVILSVVGSL